MKKLFLHIGLNKTGTSSIQHFLASNRSILKSNGVSYPSAWTSYNAHHGVARLEKIARTFGTSRVHDAPEFSAFLDEVEDSEKVILSSETLFQSERPETFKEIFENFDVTIVLYLRHKIPHILSWYQQDVQQGTCTADPIDYIFYQNISYADLVDRWVNAFGKSNVFVRVYDREKMVNGNSIDDFLETVNIAHVEGFVPPEREFNPSITGNLLHFKRVHNLFSDREMTNDNSTTALLTSLCRKESAFAGGLAIPTKYVEYWNGEFQADLDKLAANQSIYLGEPPSQQDGAASPNWATWDDDLELILQFLSESGGVSTDYVEQVVRLLPKSVRKRL